MAVWLPLAAVRGNLDRDLLADPSSTMDLSPDIQRARDAYRRRAWREAHRLLSEADEAGGLPPEDLERLARSADLVGREGEFRDTMERAHHAYLAEDRPLRAARIAFWLGMQFAERGEMGPATGWLGRARRLVDAHEGDCVEEGYLLLAAGFREFSSGNPSGGYDIGGRSATTAQRFGDDDLLALALHLQGRCLLRQARVEEGLALLDEAMVAVASDELSPHVTGLIYCSVIAACRDTYAVSRAREWTAALSDWCERHPDLVAYTDQCRVHRAEILHLRGDWPGSIQEARRAVASGPEHGSRGARAAALYQEGEAHRLLGRLAAAEEAYRQASRLGREPQPGLALLRLAQGDEEAAAGAVRRVLAETTDPLRRARLLPAHVEIMLAVHDLEEAERATDELRDIAKLVGTEYLKAASAHARGAVDLARGDPAAACLALRSALEGWRALEAPHGEARAREALALACRELGDEDSAALELDAARELYSKLGAALDLARLEPRGGPSHGLTARERQVLALVATGRTNRTIGEELFISEKTVARHISNIFSKLGVGSRAAATAYAYEHDLLDRPT